MAIRADRHNYKNAFSKHLHAYMNWKDTGSDLSKRLVLIYCVECGLKYLIMTKNRINKVNEAQPDIQLELSSHNFYSLLRSLNQAGSYMFPTIQTEHGELVRPDTYHQICRYSISPVEKHRAHIQQYDAQLLKISEWLREKM